MTKKELDFIGSMNMCDEISNEAYKKIVNHVEETEISDDCVSRQAVVEWLEHATDDSIEHAIDSNLEFLPPVTPTHGTCKDCKHNKKSHNAITLCYTTCDLGHRFELREPSTFYCADYVKRGNEND